MPNEIRGRIDSAIDRAVRGMMQVDPLPGLRHRVAGRLEPRPGRRLRIPVFATAAAVLVLVVSFAVLRQPQTPPRPEPPVAAASPVAAGPASPPTASDTASKPGVRPTAVSSVPVRPHTTGSIFGTRTGRVSAASLPSEVSEAPVEPVDTSEPPPGAIAPITIAPITVTPIRIPPLTLNPVRNQR